MAEKWFDAASQQVTLLAGRLNELLSTGLDRLHSELGVDFGVKPEIPPWVILLAACIGLLLMVAIWASACLGHFKKSPIIEVDEAILNTAQAPVKAVRAEEQKKKKRKPTEKKSQPNGRAVAELPDEVRVTEEDNQQAVPYLCPQVKTENTYEIKTKKKEKQPLKKAKKATSGVKEPEEVLGSWETKVSNKEKREQRRKDKTPGDWSGSPAGNDLLPYTLPSEQPKASPKAVPASEKKERKKKADSFKTKAEKAHVAAAVGTTYAVSGDATPAECLVVAGEWTDRAAVAPEAPVLTIVPNEELWTSPETTLPSGPDDNADIPVWGQETEGGWTVIDAGITGLNTTDVHCVSFSGPGVAMEPQPEIQWFSHPQRQPEDEWSGLNGGSSAEADGGSDWSAPAEVWGNYEEPPTVESSVPVVEEPPSVMISVKEEGATDVTGKSKKKKKKKKRAEDTVTVQESKEPVRELVTQVKVKKQSIQEPAAVEARVEKPVVVLKNTIPLTQVPPQPAGQENTEQNGLAVPTQKTSEESQPTKPVTKKKRARRET